MDIWLWVEMISVIPDALQYNQVLSSSWVLCSDIVFIDNSFLLMIDTGLDQFVGGVSLLPTILMLLEYGLAIASSTYCLTFFFVDHTMAQVSGGVNFSFVSYHSRKC